MATSVPGTNNTSSYSDGHATYVQKQEYVYSWTIHSFREWLAEIGAQAQRSPLFPEDPAAYKWRIEFKPKHKDGAIMYCSAYLELRKAPKAVNAKYEITFSDDKKKKIKKIGPAKVLFDLEPGSGWGCDKFITRETLLKRLKNDVLVISCKIEVNAAIVSERKAVEVSAVGKDLNNDLATLLAGEKFSDATITVGTKKFLVHKGILAARSSVFGAMFDNKMTENIKSIVDIVDIEPDVFGELLRYIYTDKVANLNEFAHQLFAAAGKYCILPLMTLCQQSILANLSVQNAAKTLQLADEHQAEEMKKRVLQFLSSGTALGVTDTADWKSMTLSHPHLVSEVLEAVMPTNVNAASP